MGFMSSSSDDSQASPSPDSLHWCINILVSLCTHCKIPVGCLQAMLLFTTCSCVLHTLPGFYHRVIEHLAAGKSEAPKVSYLFKESTHFIYNESQEISGGFRVKLQAVHGSVENNWICALQCICTDAPAEKQGNSSLGCFN